MRILLAAFVAPVLVVPLMASMVLATRSFQSQYSESLCRIQSVQRHAIENIMRDEPITPNFGGNECLTPMIPPIDVSLDGLTNATPTTPLP